MEAQPTKGGRGMKYRLFGILFILFFLAWQTLNGLVEGDWGRLEGGLSNLAVFFEESMWPPNWSVLEAVHTQYVNKISNSFVQSAISE